VSEDPIQALQNTVASFANARGWNKFHDPKNLAMALASEAGELAAVLRWVSNTDADAAAADPHLRQKLLEEIGDVGIVLLSLCNRVGVSVTDAIAAKLELNAQRYPVETSFGRADR
jgi:NTP pyrophosphatase (non-canonical NTP hydrolase)